jgi:hypothetical protein
MLPKNRPRYVSYVICHMSYVICITIIDTLIHHIHHILHINTYTHTTPIHFTRLIRPLVGDTHTYTHPHIHTYPYTHTFIYSYTHIPHTHTHTHTHTYTYTHRLIRPLVGDTDDLSDYIPEKYQVGLIDYFNIEGVGLVVRCHIERVGLIYSIA